MQKKTAFEYGSPIFKHKLCHYGNDMDILVIEKMMF